MAYLIAPEIKSATKIFSFIKKVSEQNTINNILAKLESDEITLSEAKRKSPSYLACLIRTIEAVERASTVEKINTLKNLFVVSDSLGLIEKQPDFYQEILSIFSELSYREVLILYYLDKGGLPYTNDLHVKEPEKVADDETLPNPHEQNEEANQYCAYQVGVNIDVLGALLGRLTRTGLIGNAPEWTSLVYFFTPLYRELKQFFAFDFYES
ncbi:hypothetical protein CJF42_16120 [Pseudoalteromonas sp. NBT06-2]|uniref:hypothetical protein n=1 Tax=Pseudoalteromonas sp. NBT06-2 TaxID=2025950 RepID=UPI000BA6DCB8|nr:hypothetical protein [Pseudoalteromonas sp. NBT06-2]PAJ73390.1 hypothetical protein CJF42_16120 [Pseudoalteromonas sp. NBT06-2]